MKKYRQKKNRIKPILIVAVLLSCIWLIGCNSIIYEDIVDVYENLIADDNETPTITVPDTKPSASESKEETSEAREPVSPETEEIEEVTEQEEPQKTTVDLIFFMGQSNMSGTGGNAAYAPKVNEGCGYEFRAISDPTKLYPITEPFGINENNLNAVLDVPGAKKGSLVSAFVNKYYELTGTPVVALSASAGATDTDFWMSEPVVADYTERLKRAIVWLESSDYEIRHKYVVWLQGESDAIENTSSEQYEQNMSNIIRPMFIEGVEKVFFITPGRTITRKNYFQNIIDAQTKMSRESGYYALGTTVLSGISTEYMVDEWHYNQSVLNLVGEECAKSVAYYTENNKECCLYDYRNNCTFVPTGDGVVEEEVQPLDFSQCNLRTTFD